MNRLIYSVPLMILLTLTFYSATEQNEARKLKFELQAKEMHIQALQQKIDSLALLTNFPNLALDIYSCPLAPSIIKGNEFRSEIGLKILSGITIHQIKVNDKEIPLKEGIGTFKTTPKFIGQRAYTAQVIYENPISKTVDTLEKRFLFETKDKMTSISSQNNRILYRYQLNKLDFVSNEFPFWMLRANARNQAGNPVKLEKRSGNMGAWSILPSQEDTIVRVELIHAQSRQQVGSPVSFYIRELKNLPTFPSLSNTFTEQKTRYIKADTMRIQKKLYSSLSPYDFQSTCYTWQCSVDYTPKGGKTRTFYVKQGGDFEGELLKIIQQTKVGDTFRFYNTESKCYAVNHAFNKTEDVLYEVN